MNWRLRLVPWLLALALVAGCGATPAATPTGEQPTSQPAAETTEAATVDVATPEATPAVSAEVNATPVESRVASPARPSGSPAGGTPGTPVSSVLAAGAADATNGPLRTNRLVTFYGHPFSDRMGVLGEYDPEQMVARLKRQAAAYTAADPKRPAIPTIELIASVVQDVPGPDGLYLQRTPPGIIEQYARLAEQHQLLLLLDIQVGRGTVADDVRVLLPYLKRPYVHLAIDPEFAIKEGQTPGDQFGSIDASDILGAARTLADVVTENGIGDKVLLVHQFVPSMIANKQLLKPVPHVELVLNTDGFGPAPVKKESYDILVHDEPVQYGGIKLFYKQDEPLMTPEEVLALVPTPVVVIFQ